MIIGVVVLLIGFVMIVTLFIILSSGGTSSGFSEKIVKGYASDKIVVTYVD